MLHIQRIWATAIMLSLSVSVVQATVMPPDTSFFNYRDTFCSNQTLLVGNQFFDAANPNGTVVLPGAAAGGGDSVIFVNLVFYQIAEITLDQNVCEGDTVWVNGTAYHSNFYLGEETIENGAANGCDSIIHINLTFFPTVVIDFQATICEGDTIFVNNNPYYAFHSQGIEVIKNGTSGCDSTIRVQLEVLTPPFSTITDTLCPDGFMMVNGRRYDRNNRTGLEILPDAGAAGCDSLVYLELSFRELWIYVGEDLEIVKGDQVCIQSELNLVPQSLEWSPATPCLAPDCSIICVEPLSNITYRLTATDTSGCVVTDEITISVSNENRVYAPNVFNPDAAEPNNRFFLSADNGVAIVRRLLIADRWGEILFDKENLSPDDSTQGWDGTWRGKVAQVGVYTYWAELERVDGTRFEKGGTVSLVR